MLVRIRHPERLIYPESDGKPMGENTLQVKWIITLFNGLQALFRDRNDVFVAADLFWYPKPADPTTVTAPDVMVVFGRPKSDRPSYKQWEEDNIPPQVVIEILSPGSTEMEMVEKFKFYRSYGVEEYYLYDPKAHHLSVWRRSGRKLVSVKVVNGWVSPRLKVRFEANGTEPWKIIRPDGTAFRSYLELLADSENERKRADEASQRAIEASQRADEASQRALEASQRADAANQRAIEASQRADEASERAASLAARLRELGVDPDTV